MILSCLFFTIVLFSNITLATPLGKNVNDSSAKAKVSTQSLKVISKVSSLGAAYSIRETTDDIRTLKEFVREDGVVFAVSWQGLGRPDFSEIFGDYYSEYSRELKSQMKGRHRNRMQVNASGIVVTNSGHGSFMQGLAYIPNLLPVGMAPGDLK
ncbi:MAG: DUF2844 domain-containing protein [Pseudobdellovibrionaceae bacterium]